MLELPKNLQCYKQISIENKDKTQFFLNKHSTKEGSWGILKLNSGEIGFVFMDEHNNELLCQHVTPDSPEVLIFPGALHRIKLIKNHNFNVNINFYCSPHRYFEKKYSFRRVHSDLLYAYSHYIPTSRRLNILDVGCGSGRNLLFLAKQGHYVTGLDCNSEALKKVKDISRQENIKNIKLVQVDLNTSIGLEYSHYDLVISTVSLQFLLPESVYILLQYLRKATKVGGIHVLVFPIKKAPFEFPESFTYLPEKQVLYKNYQNAGWTLLEYKEKTGQLHKLDKFARPIQGEFGFLLAQRIA